MSEKVNIEELKTALDLVEAPLKDAQKLDAEMGTGTFIFRDGKVYTYNDRMAVYAPSPLKETVSVAGGVFHSLVNKLAAAATEEVEITVKKNVMLLKSDGWFNGEVPLRNREGSAADKFIDSLQKTKLKFIAIDEKFKEALRLCRFTTSKDVTLSALTGVYFNDKEIISSDAYRISRYNLSKGLGASFVISFKVVHYLVGLDIKSFADSKAWAYFKTEGGATIACRKMNVKYPESVGSSLVETQKKAKHIAEARFPAAAVGMVDICSSIFSDGKSSAQNTVGEVGEETFVEITMKDGVFVVKSTAAAGKVLCQKKATKWGKEAYRLLIDPNFLGMIMELSDKFKTVGDVLVFEAGDFCYVTTYIRPDEV